jgi:multiple sugar transport system substrate-binding protein
LAGLAAVALAGSLAACSGSGSGGQTGDDGQTRIVWSTWGTPEELGRFEEFNEAFMDRHPDIEVDLQAVPSYDDYHPKLLTQLTSGTAPDVFYVGDDNIGNFVDEGVLQPLDDRMADPDSQAQAEDFFDGLYGAARKDDVTYGVPTDCNPDVLWYDKVALEEAGITEDPAQLAEDGEWTIDAFVDMTEKLKANGKIGAIFWNYWATHYSWISANGGSAYDEEGNFVLPDDPASVAALEQLGALFQDGTFAVADTMPDGAGADAKFVAHEAGFFSQGRYTIGTLTAAGDQESYDIAPWPSTDGSNPSTGVAAAYLAINKDTEAADAAWTFFEEFVSAEGQEFRLSGGGNAVPSVKGADEVVLEGFPEHAQTFLTVRDSGFANYPAEARVPGLSGDISTAMLSLYEGEADVEETLTTITDLQADAD